MHTLIYPNILAYFLALQKMNRNTYVFPFPFSKGYPTPLFHSFSSNVQQIELHMFYDTTVSKGDCRHGLFDYFNLFHGSVNRNTVFNINRALSSLYFKILYSLFCDSVDRDQLSFDAPYSKTCVNRPLKNIQNQDLNDKW